MLAYRHNDAWHRWEPGRRLPDGSTPPRRAEELLDLSELEALGLHPVTREAVPEGQVATDWSLVDVEGMPVYRPTLEAAPPPAPVYVPVATARERLEAIEKWDDLVAALPPAKLAKLLSLREGISPDDEEARAVLTAIGADPDAILAAE